MKYLCLAYEEEKTLNALSQSGRVLPDRRQGSERGHPGSVAVAVGAALGSIEVRPIEEELRQDSRYG